MADTAPRTVSSDQPAGGSPPWNKTTRYVVAVFLFIAGIFVIVLMGPIFQTLVWAFLFAFAAFLPSAALARHTPISYRLAVVLIYLIFTVIIIALLLVITPDFINGMNELRASLQASLDERVEELEAYEPEDGIVQIIDFEVDLNPIVEPMRAFILISEEEGLAAAVGDAAAEAEKPREQLKSTNLQVIIQDLSDVVSWLGQRLGGLISGLVGYIAILVTAAYIAFIYLLELPKSRGVIYNWIPASYEHEVGLMLLKIDQTWSSFFRGQLVVAVLLVIASYIQFVLTGLPGAGVLAVLVGLLSLIPWTGGLIATIILGVVALLQGSTVFVDMPNWQFALLTVLINGILTQIAHTVIQPLTYGEAVDISATSMVVGVSLGLALGGILGAFLVVPIIGTLRILVHYLMSKVTQRDPYPDEEMPDPSGEGFFSEVFYFRRRLLASE
jgi:predicted PurR-regulated permease PerM